MSRPSKETLAAQKLLNLSRQIDILRHDLENDSTLLQSISQSDRAELSYMASIMRDTLCGHVMRIAR